MNAITRAHDYLSTACCHGLHDRCRKACKFCGEPCRCTCHKEQRLADRYRELGIDVNNPNPDGSDYHLMNAVDQKLDTV